MRTSSLLTVLVVLLVAAPALAQKVVILELDGDPTGRLRAQVEGAVRTAGAPELVPLAKYKEMAARRRLKGAAAMTPVGVMRVAKLLGLDAAVGGELNGRIFHVVIWDRAGQELWTKDLKVQAGLLSEDFAAKLSRAISAAAQQGAARQTAQPPTEEVVVVPEQGGEGAPEVTSPSSGDTGRRVVEAVAEPQPTQPQEDRDTDLDSEGSRRRKASSRAHPPRVRFWLHGTTTWRSQCLRPGVDSCAEYDQRAEAARTDPTVYVPTGVTINFNPTAPYPGGAGAVEVFPFAGNDSRVLEGLGLLGDLGYGVLAMQVTEQTDAGDGPKKTVVSSDTAWSLQAAWRFHFFAGSGEPRGVGHVGLRAGLQGRNFSIDPNSGVPLPSSLRVAPTQVGYPVVGLDLSFPISRYFRLDASGAYFVNPQTGPEQIIGYGNPRDTATGGVVSSGFMAEGGFSGDIWGPLGWAARVRYTRYADRYYGQGQKWRDLNEQQNGGASEEAYLAICWGVTVKL